MEVTEHELRQMYCDNKMTQLEIADVYGVGHATISRRMKEHGIKSRMHSETKLNKTYIPSKEKLYNMYWIRKMSQREISKEICIPRSNVYNLMARYGIKSRTILESKLNPAKPPKNILEKMYTIEKMSSREISNEMGVDQATILNWMRSYDIESRALSYFTGENAGNWQGGLSFEPYCQKFNNSFKEAVRERDDYICQLCGCTQESHDRKLDVHHIHYDKKNCYPDVIALCRSCNLKVNGNRDYWEQYFENQLLERGLVYWSLSQSKET